MDKWQKLESKLREGLQRDFPLSQVTTLAIGGPAKYFYTAKTQQDLTEVLKFCRQEGVAYLVIGGGSNLLVSDEGFDGLVIKNEVRGIKSSGSFARPGLAGVSLVAQGGTVLQDLVDFTAGHGLAGMEKLAGIPGTVAGAIYGNAGAYGQTISDCLTQVLCFDGKTTRALTKQECSFGYRDSSFQSSGLIILEAKFDLPEGNPDELKNKVAETLALRNQKYQPGTLCPGSFFKNLYTSQIPPQTRACLPERKDTYGKTPAYVLLESIGAKGDRLGDIQISPNHANLFINLGSGTAADFWQLANKWHSLVKQKYGLELEPEVQLINLPKLGGKI